MKNNRYQFLISIVVILLALTILGVGNAPPILPSSFYGTVMVNGAYVSDGTIISAWIDGNKYAEVGTFTFESKSVYTIEVPVDNPDTVEKDGGEEGDTVVYKIGSDTADQTGTWHSGTNVEVNLTASTTTPAPAANFSGSPISGDAPLVVDFVDSSTGSISSWSWDFGDSGSSSAQNPSHEYTTLGTYTVALTVAGPGGSDTETKVDCIEVAETGRLVADFTGNLVSGFVPLMVSFTELSSGDVTSWFWTFGDGGSSTDPNPTYVYALPGTFTVSLKVSNSESFDIEQKLNYITVSEISPESYIVYLPVIHQ